MEESYNIVKHQVLPIVENIHILYPYEFFSKEEVFDFILKFKSSYKTTKKLNVYVYHPKIDVSLIDNERLRSIETESDKQMYIRLADYFLACKFFDFEHCLWYPFKDELYESIKKEAV